MFELGKGANTRFDSTPPSVQSLSSTVPYVLNVPKDLMHLYTGCSRNVIKTMIGHPIIFFFGSC